MGNKPSNDSQARASPQYEVIQLTEDKTTTNSDQADTSDQADVDANLDIPLASAQESNNSKNPENSNVSGADNPQLLWLHSWDNGTSMEVLSKEQRNEAVRNDPIGVITTFQAAKLKAIAYQQGSYGEAEALVSWKPSFLPFVLEYTIACDEHECQHLASVNDRRTRDPANYAKYLIPAAKSFLRQPFGSHQSHLPFIWLPGKDDLDPNEADEEKVRRTMAHAQSIASQYNEIDEIDIDTAEMTARMINANKLVSSLLELLLKPGSVVLEHLSKGRDSEAIKPETSKLKSQSRGSDAESLDASKDNNIMETHKNKTKSMTDSPATSLKDNLNHRHSQGLVEPFQESSKMVKQQKSSQDMSESRSVPEDQMPNNQTPIPQSTDLNSKKKKKSKKRAKKKKRQASIGTSLQPLETGTVLTEDNDTSPGPNPSDVSSNDRNSTALERDVVKEVTGKLLENPAIDLTSDADSLPVVSEESETAAKAISDSQKASKPQSPRSKRDDNCQISDNSTSILDRGSKTRSTGFSFALRSEVDALKDEASNRLSPLSEKSVEDESPPTLTPTISHHSVPDLELPLPVVASQYMNVYSPHIIDDIRDEYIPVMNRINAIKAESGARDSFVGGYQVTPERISPASSNSPNPGPENSSGVPIYQQPGPQGLAWAYATNTDADVSLRNAGIWLWERPITYYRPYSIPTNLRDPSKPAHVAVSHERTDNSDPLIEYDGNTVHIIPHREPWEDVRSQIAHVDFLPATQLVEYQACEAAGYRVWRHDRDFLPCRYPGCNVKVIDYAASATVCPFCGPDSIIRYCSFAHQIYDLDQHWSECGDPDHIIKDKIIDHTTLPAHLTNLPPPINDSNGIYGIKSAVLQRQKIYAMKSEGHYTLFNPPARICRTLEWPAQNPNSPDLNQRIQRLLNIAFFDVRHHHAISYLYRLLHCLISSNRNPTNAAIIAVDLNILHSQFHAEFRPATPFPARPAPLCECEWFGPPCFIHHQPHQQQPLLPIVEALEAKNPILRVWRTQHPTIKDWNLRAAEAEPARTSGGSEEVEGDGEGKGKGKAKESAVEGEKKDVWALGEEGKEWGGASK